MAEIANTQFPADADPARLFRRATALDRAGPEDLVLVEVHDVEEAAISHAGVCLVARSDVHYLPPGMIALITPEPRAAFRRIAARLHPHSAAPQPLRDRPGIDIGAIVDEEARIERGVVLDPGVVVGPRAEIGAGTSIGANSVIGPGVRIGRGCAIDSHVSIRVALIGDRVTIHAGARIGLGGRVTPHLPDIRLGRIIIQNDVEIGANATLERGTLRDTIIGEGARIAPLVRVSGEALVDRLRSIEAGVVPPSSIMA